MPDLRGSHRWQLLVFVGAILLPSVALVVVGRQTMRQNRELAVTHRKDEQRARKERIAREMRARLDAVKPADPLVALVARVEAGRLVLPWEPEPEVLFFRGWPPDAAAAIQRADQAQYGGDRDLRTAVAAYSQALRLSANRLQQSYARLQLSGALQAQRRAKEAAAAARLVLDSPPEMADQDGIPLSIRAAELLVNSPADRPAIRRALKSAVEGRHWLSPNAVYPMTNLADQLLKLAADEDPAWNTEFRDRLAAVNRLHEQAEALQNDFATRPPDADTWTYRHGAEPWLVAVVSDGGRPQSVVAVRAGDFF